MSNTARRYLAFLHRRFNFTASSMKQKCISSWFSLIAAKKPTSRRVPIASAVDPGDDLGLVTTRLVHWLLSDPDFGVAGLTRNPELRQAIDRVAALHLRSLESDPPTREEWKGVQSFLLDFTDNSGSSSAFEEMDGLISQIVENSATSCSDSDVIGDEIVIPIAQLHARMQASDINHTVEEIALKEHIEKLTGEKNTSLAEERKRPEVKALYVKINNHYRQVLALRAQAIGRIARQFIAMTRGA
jgi:hypothetical protein